MDLDRLSAEIVQRLRGARSSQKTLSRKLGYRSNVLYLWEQGRRFPSAGAFFALAEARGVPLAAKLREFLGEGAGRYALRTGTRREPIAVGPLLIEFAAGRGAAELARLTGLDRNTIARWLSGKSQPRLPELLMFVGATTLRLIDFVALFVDPEQLEGTRQVYQQLSAQRQLAYSSPWSHGVLRALELDAYRARRHQPALLAARLGISTEAVEANLEALLSAGQVSQAEGRFRPNQVLNVDTRADFEHNLRLKQFWSQVAEQRVRGHARNRQSLFSYNLFSISHADLQTLRELQLEHYHRVRQLVASARGADHVVLLNLQLVVLDE